MEAGIFAKVHTQNYSISKTWNPIKTSCQMFSSCLISLTILVICSVRFHSNSSDKSLHSAHGDDNQNSKAAAIRPIPRFQLLDVMVSHMGPITTNLLPLLPPHHLHAIIKKYLLTMHGHSELVNCKELGDVNPGCPALQLTGILLGVKMK